MPFALLPRNFLLRYQLVLHHSLSPFFHLGFRQLVVGVQGLHISWLCLSDTKPFFAAKSVVNLESWATFASLKVGDLIASHSEFLPSRRSIACLRYNLFLWVVEMLANSTHFVLDWSWFAFNSFFNSSIFVFAFDSLCYLITFLAVLVSWSAVYRCCCCMMLYLKSFVTLIEFWYSSSDIFANIGIAKPPYFAGRESSFFSIWFIFIPSVIAGINFARMMSFIGFNRWLISGIVLII